MTTLTGTCGAASAVPGATALTAADPASRWRAAVGHLDPLPERDCVSCGRPAVLGTPDGFRCAACPPVWGMTPGRELWGRPVAPVCACGARCYCGRGGHYPHRVAARPVLMTVEAQVALTDLQLANARRADDLPAAAAVRRARQDRRDRPA